MLKKLTIEKVYLSNDNKISKIIKKKTNNIVIYVNVQSGTYEKRGHYEMVEKVGLYWHFVDLVWVFVFTFFYLI